MQTMVRVIVILGITISMALAGDGRETMGSSLFTIVFLGFGAIIVVFQLIPGLMLFCSMIKGLFGKGEERRERINVPTAELGLTMADGGSRVRKAEEKTVPVKDKTEGNV